MSEMVETIIAQRLESIEADGRFRTRASSMNNGPQRRVGGDELLCFDGNDYLGLSQNRHMVRALTGAAEHWGLGSGGSPLLAGYSVAHQGLEERAAQWLGHERALFFSNGYQANLALIGGLLERGDRVIQDRINHASLIDGARLAGCELQRYQHRDLGSFGNQLKRSSDGLTLAVTESVFSMDGDVAPLNELHAQVTAAGGLFAVDDAHAVGVLGPNAAGLAAGMANRPDLVTLTFGKALGCHGALIAGRHDLIELIMQRGRSYIYSTALPPALAAVGMVAIELAIGADSERETLFRLIDRFRIGARQLGLPLLESDHPIQPLVIGSSQRAVAISSALTTAGIRAPAIRPPTVPEGSARLRITLTASHCAGHVDRLLDALEVAYADDE